MSENPYEEIDKACPLCGQRAVWYCSLRDCPKSTDQVNARKTWQDRQTDPPEDPK